MSAGPQLRTGTAADLPQVLDINNAAVPAVNTLSLESLTALFHAAADFQIATLGGAVVGFMLCIGPGAAYDSVNYAFFAKRYDNFMYIDRIALSPSVQRQGLGKRMYAAAIAAAAAQGAVLVCEVNVRPRNDASLAFHERLGFRSVGEQEGGHDDAIVSMLLLEAVVGQSA